MHIKITPQFNCEKYHKDIITLNFPKFKSVFYCRKLITCAQVIVNCKRITLVFLKHESIICIAINIKIGGYVQ